MVGFSPRATPSFIQRQLDQVQPAQHLLGFMSPASDVSDPFVGDQPPAAMAPLFRNKLRGLRLTEGTDAVLQCSVVGVPKPSVSWGRGGGAQIGRESKTVAQKQKVLLVWTEGNGPAGNNTA